MMTPPQPQTEDIKRDLQATLAARRELGGEYDDHFLSALAEKLTAQARQEIANTPRPHEPSNRLSRDQRTGLAICSLIFGIPIIAISISAGPFYFIVAIGLIALLNVLASR
ncbi:MAG TPA: hypothetical protein VF812_19230 [Ktedonobacterales bacterium]